MSKILERRVVAKAVSLEERVAALEEMVDALATKAKVAETPAAAAVKAKREAAR